MVSKKPFWTAVIDRIKALSGQRSLRPWIIGAVVFLGLFGLLMVDLLPSGVDLRVGQVSPVDVMAPTTQVYEAETQRRREAAGRSAVREASEDAANYDVDSATVAEAEEDMEKLFEMVFDKPLGDTVPGTSMEERREYAPEIAQWVRTGLDIQVQSEHIDILLASAADRRQELEHWMKSLLLGPLEDGIASGEAQEAVEDIGAQAAGNVEFSRLAPLVVALADAFFEPNLVLDLEAVEEARQQAKNAVEPVTIVEGEAILRKGDVVRRNHLELLSELGIRRDGADYPALVGLAGFVLALMALPGVYLYQYRRSILLQDGLLGLLALVVLTVAAVTKVLDLVQWQAAIFLSPIALAGMLTTLLLEARLALMIVTSLSIVAAVLAGFDFAVGAVLLAGGVAGVYTVSHVSQRGDLMRAGFIVGAVQFTVMIFLALMTSDLSLAGHSYLAWVNGVLSSVIAIGFLPYLESLFGITSAIRLLELSNPNQPVLRRLLMETPGTYHHSIIVGNLAEAAADAIGADGLLARVGATYHDIGKLKRPYFFGENQVGGHNPHDRIAASLSTLIITSHVKDGLELAKEYRLPRVVRQFISQHHGTDLVKFFYHRAREQGGDSVDEKRFRYSGPKPQTKETAIVSLADAVEAAVRSLSKTSPGKIEGLVHKIIKDRLHDGQLDECELTFKDLDYIAHAFTNVLVGIFHARVEYPDNIKREDIEGKRS